MVITTNLEDAGYRSNTVFSTKKYGFSPVVLFWVNFENNVKGS